MPDYRLPALEDDVRKLFNRIGTVEKSLEIVAAILGHSPKSSAFKIKIASMRAYGLIEGRGEIRVSEIGEKIARHRNHEEYKEAIINAIRNIPLWNNFYRTFTERGEEPWKSRTALMLSTYCGLAPEKATEMAPEVIKQYNEDVKAIGRDIVVVVNENLGITERVQPIITSEKLVDYGFGKYRVYLPENEQEAKAVWSRLKKMVDSVIGEEKPK